ncbi:hypothetical protein JCM3770_007125 [Rhodotorula araucariae]
MQALEEEREQYHYINRELESTRKDLERRVEVRTADLERAKAAAPPRPAVKEAVQTRREPVILVLIDGSSAPFSEKFISRGWEGGAEAGAQVRWEVEKDLREHSIEIDEKNDVCAPQPAVLCFVWHNRKALVYNLKETRVISNDGEWDSFLAGFNSVSNNHAMDIGDARICVAMSRLISTVGDASATKRIYLAGIYLEELLDSLPDLRPELHVEIVPKLVLIDHRETDDARDALLLSGWRVARFLRFFSSSRGLGGDLGWAYRPPSPILGPDDGNHDPGTDEQGYEEVYQVPTSQLGSGRSRVRKGRGGL